MTDRSRIFLALFVLALSVWSHQELRSEIARYPLQDYCGVGICSTALPNRVLERNKNRFANADQMLLQAIAEIDAEPSSPYAWADLAELEQLAGDSVRAEYAFRRAIDLAPGNIDIGKRFLHLRQVRP